MGGEAGGGSGAAAVAEGADVCEAAIAAASVTVGVAEARAVETPLKRWCWHQPLEYTNLGSSRRVCLLRLAAKTSDTLLWGKAAGVHVWNGSSRTGGGNLC